MFSFHSHVEVEQLNPPGSGWVGLLAPLGRGAQFASETDIFKFTAIS